MRLLARGVEKEVMVKDIGATLTRGSAPHFSSLANLFPFGCADHSPEAPSNKRLLQRVSDGRQTGRGGGGVFMQTSGSAAEARPCQQNTPRNSAGFDAKEK